jgi:hypothetical protein
MEVHPVVQDLETRFLTRLEGYAEPLRSDFPNIKVEVWSWSVGSLTDFQGHNLGIDCTMPDVPLNRPNNIALIIEVMHLTTEPRLCDAIVCWGHPSGAVEAALIRDGALPYNESTISIVEERLDELVAALREALRRGIPSD